MVAVYRFDLFDQPGEITSISRYFHLPNDKDALALAAAMLSASARIEVWQGNRLVGQFPAPFATNADASASAYGQQSPEQKIALKSLQSAIRSEAAHSSTVDATTTHCALR
jgi:hypothetical protein